MKNKFLAILLSAVLLLTMVPFAFASSADSDAEGIVQGTNDAVIIMHGTISGGFAVFFNHFGNNQIDKTGTVYDRIIFVFANDYTYQLISSGHLGQSAMSGSESFVFTSKCTITDPDKTFVSNDAAISSYTGSAGLLNYFDNEDAAQNVQFQAGNSSGEVRFLIFHCETKWDYITFKCLGNNFLFYLSYYNTTFGAHYQNVPAGDGASYTQYPCIVNGRANPNNQKEATFSGTQTINILASSWAYIAPSSRDAKANMNGTINVNLKNATFKAETNVSTGAPNSTVMMARDVFGASARINVTAEGCTFKQFALFGTNGNSGNQFSSITNAGQLAVTLKGYNYFERGIENLRYSKNFDDVFTGTPSLTLNINGPVSMGVGKTIDGLDNTTLTSTVTYNGIYADAHSMLNFDVMNDTADYTGYSTDENGAIVYVNTDIPAVSCGFGKTPAEPVRTLDQAFRALEGIGTGGTVELAQGCWFPEAVLPTLAGDVIITSDYQDNLLVLLGVLQFHNNVTFKDVNFGKTGSIKVIFMHDHDLTFENCGFYENDGGLVVGTPPVKGASTTESSLAVSTAPRANTTNDAIKDDRVIDQTVTVTGNADGFTLLRIAAGYKANQHLADTYIAEDTSSGCTGEVNIVIGENASVGIIDTVSENNSYDVNITLPAAQMDGVELRSTSDVGSASTVIYTTKAADVQDWLTADVDYDFMGYSLRAKNTSGKFAMRAGFTAPAAALDAAAEYGVLVKRQENPNALVWFDNGYAPGITELPAAQTYNKGVGKSVVYLNPVLDNADKETLTADGRYIFSCPVVLSTLNATTAAYEYDFTPYAVYAITVDDAPAYYYTYGADEGITATASLNDMIDAVNTNGSAQAKALAAAITAEIGG